MALIGDLKPYFGEISRLLRSIAQSLCKEVATTTQTVSAGTASVPAGFRSVTFTKTSPNTDTVIITLPDATTYTLTQLGETITIPTTANHTLPAFTVSGVGTVQWIGLK